MNITAGLAYNQNQTEPVDKHGEPIVPPMTDLIKDKFRYALFGDDDKYNDWTQGKCHYNRLQTRCDKSGKSHTTLPEAVNYFSGYVIKLECDLAGTRDKSGCCLLDGGHFGYGGWVEGYQGGYCLF